MLFDTIIQVTSVYQINLLIHDDKLNDTCIKFSIKILRKQENILVKMKWKCKLNCMPYSFCDFLLPQNIRFCGKETERRK